MTKRNKPALAIIPTINFEYDRNNQDTYMGGKELLIGKFNNNKSFFRDYEKNIFLGLNLRELEVGFYYRVRVSTRAQQIDLYRHMELAFKIGFTQYEYIQVDFHIPMELMLNIANHAGFLIEDNKIKDIVGFVNYMNSYSEFPITYKLRTINGKNEFFIRVPNVYVHIACLDKLSADDGEVEGVGTNNFNIDMQAVLRIMVPHYYVYKSAQKITKYIPTSELDSTIGIYTFKVFDIPETNERKWAKYITTAYELDYTEQINIPIDISVLFKDDLKKIINDHLNIGISPSSFIDIRLYNYSENSPCTIDWINMILTVPEFISGRIHIVIYMDMKYYNELKL
jgi:hypothetical protein